MAKQHIDIEKIFENGFDDFAPKTSEHFDKKMASHIGLSAAAGLSSSANLANTTSLAKTGGLAKAALLKSVAIIKTIGIVKTVAIIATVSTITVFVVNVVEDKQESKNKTTQCLEERNEKMESSNLGIMEAKTIHLLDSESFMEPYDAQFLHSKERNCSIGMIDSKYEADETQQELTMDLDKKEADGLDTRAAISLSGKNSNIQASSILVSKT